MVQPPAPKFGLVQLFKDPTPHAVINARILISTFNLFEATSLGEKEKGTILNIVTMIARKMATVWSHKERYLEEQQRLIADLPNHPLNPNLSANIVLSQELFSEFDEFLVQIKSTLDYLVKVPTPIFGKKIWNLHTFGAKGDEVVRVLRHNLPREYKPSAKACEKMLFEHHRPWLENVISMRDRINHYLEEGISPHAFSVFKDGDQTRVPMFSREQTIGEVMEIVWLRFLIFVEDFIAMMLSFKTDGPFCFLCDPRVPPDQPTPRWRVVTKADRDRVIQNPGWEKME